MTATEPATSFILNCGVFGPKYDAKTGLYSNFGRGIYEFRVGDEIENVHNGKRDRIVALYPRPVGQMGSPCIIEVERGRRCCCLVAKPVNSERITFGFVVTTLSDFNGQPVGSASRWPTREAAEREVQRLVSIDYPGAIMVLDSE